MKPALLLITVVLVSMACGEDSPPLEATDSSVRKPMPGMKMSAGYVTLINHGPAPIRITRVTSPQFEAVELHETRIEDGVSRMTEIGTLTIPPASQVVFEPGAKHLMLMRPRGALDTVTLVFYSDDDIVLTIDVTPDG